MSKCFISNSIFVPNAYKLFCLILSNLFDFGGSLSQLLDLKKNVISFVLCNMYFTVLSNNILRIYGTFNMYPLPMKFLLQNSS